ncbi:MAG: response regulator [Desulfobacteraceae bacterium]|nr:MAG: response regulator [Desulfobacteraceae bacterium]
MPLMGHDFKSDKILSILKSSRFFEQFKDDQIQSLISFSHIQHCLKDEVILKEETPNDKLYILLGGQIRVLVKDELILTMDAPGSMIGEMSVITGTHASATVVADHQTALLAIPSGTINDSGNAEVQSIWYKIFSDILTERLSQTTKKVVGFQETSAELHLKKKELAHKSVILQSVLGSMSDGVVVTDASGQPVHVNQAFRELVGGVEIPKNYIEWPDRLGLYEPDQRTILDSWDLPMNKADRGILVDADEIYVENPALDEGVWLQAISSRLRSDTGDQLEGSVVVFRNHTRAKQSQQALIKAKEHAEATAKAKSRFLSVMSHELKTPLNGILGMSSLLDTTPLSNSQKEYTQSIIQSGKILLDKIQNILFYNLLESDEVIITSNLYSPKVILEDIINTFSPAAKAKGIILKQEMSQEACIPVYGDAAKIKRIIGFLVDNAIKFTHEGHVQINLTCSASNTVSQNLLFTVKDTGIGISNEKMHALFQPFSQADDSLHRRFEGTGLGLAITQKLTQKLGGNIQIKSTLKKGTMATFSIDQNTLQIQEVDLENGLETETHSELDEITVVVPKSFSARKKRPAPYKIDPSFAKKTPLDILVAEDNMVNQLLVKKVLTRLGYQPDVVPDGLQAVDACKEKAYDLVLMDIQMPEMDGIEATQTILASDDVKTKPAIVALTANTTDEIKQQCQTVGMVSYLSKPLSIERLMDTLSNLKQPDS